MGCSASKVDKSHRVLLLGLDGSGSTALLYQLRLGQMVTTIPTIGFNVENVCYKSTEFQLWDIGGQDKIRPLWRHYLTGTRALVFSVDSANKDRFPEALVALRKLLEQQELQGVPLIVLANKQDIEGAASKDEVMLALELIYLQKREWYIVGTSVTTQEGLADFLDKLHSVCIGKGPNAVVL